MYAFVGEIIPGHSIGGRTIQRVVRGPLRGIQQPRFIGCAISFGETIYGPSLTASPSGVGRIPLMCMREHFRIRGRVVRKLSYDVARRKLLAIVSWIVMNGLKNRAIRPPQPLRGLKRML